MSLANERKIIALWFAFVELLRRSSAALKPAPTHVHVPARPWQLIEVDGKQVRPLLAQLRDGRHVIVFERSGYGLVGLHVGATVPNERIIACFTFTSIDAIEQTRKILLATKQDMEADAELIRIGVLRSRTTQTDGAS